MSSGIIYHFLLYIELDKLDYFKKNQYILLKMTMWRGQGQEQGSQEQDLTLWKAASLRSSSAVRDAEKEAVSLSRMKWTGSRHHHQGKTLSFSMGESVLKLLHLRFNANPVVKINSRSSLEGGGKEEHAR